MLCGKEENKQKRGRDWPIIFLKKEREGMTGREEKERERWVMIKQGRQPSSKNAKNKNQI